MNKASVRIEDLKKADAALRLRKGLFALTGLLLLVVLVIAATAWGSAEVPTVDIAKALFAKFFPFLNLEVTYIADTIVWSLRLPRIAMAIVAGAGFAVSGVVMQGILRNPLVSPYTIGISHGAGFGASLAIVLGVGVAMSGKYLIIGNAFFFALLSALLVYAVARFAGVTAETLILSGIALMYLLSASTSLLQYIATEHELKDVVFWLFGSLSGSTWESIGIVTAVVGGTFPILMKYSWDLNALASGDDVAVSLGINAKQVRAVVMILASLITATIICFNGIIGFVCLVAPHITRMIIGSVHRYLIPLASIVGAVMLLAADTVSRIILDPVELPVGIVTAYVGVPMFVYLLISRRKNYFQ